MDESYKRSLHRAIHHLGRGADAVCDGIAAGGQVPRLNAMTGGYSWDDDYVWDSWADFQWAGFLAGRLWLLHLLTRDARYAGSAMHICERIGPVLANRQTVFSFTGLDMYYALTLGHKVTGDARLKAWAFAGGDNFANIFDGAAGAFLQISGADRIVIDTGLNLPSMLWAAQWEPERASLAYRHLDKVLELGLVRADGSSCHAAALDPQTRAATRLFSLQGWSDDSVWARGQAWAMLGYGAWLRGEPTGSLPGCGEAGRRLVCRACTGGLGSAIRLPRSRPVLAALRFLRCVHRNGPADAPRPLAPRTGLDSIDRSRARRCKP